MNKQLYHKMNHTQISEKQKETFFGRLMECFHVRDQHDLMLVSPHSNEKETERNRCITEGFTGDRQRSAPVTGRLWDFPVGYVQIQ